MIITSLDLIAKFTTTFILAAGSFMILNGSDWTWPFIIGTVATVINFEWGDYKLLPRYGTMAASVGEGLMAALTAYVADLLVPAFATSLISLVAFALLVMLSEYLFHDYLEASKELAP